MPVITISDTTYTCEEVHIAADDRVWAMGNPDPVMEPLSITLTNVTHIDGDPLLVNGGTTNIYWPAGNINLDSAREAA